MPDTDAREELQMAYNALCSAEASLEKANAGHAIRDRLAELRFELGRTAFPPAPPLRGKIGEAELRTDLNRVVNRPLGGSTTPTEQSRLARLGRILATGGLSLVFERKPRAEGGRRE